MRDDWESLRSFIMWLAALPGETSGTWLNETNWFRTLVSALPAPAARLFANIQTTGKDGGHDSTTARCGQLASIWSAGSPERGARREGVAVPLSAVRRRPKLTSLHCRAQITASANAKLAQQGGHVYRDCLRADEQRGRYVAI